jgi:PIN domain nuclease of toxin-antitoxin system
MRLLLDTHALLWFLLKDSQLSNTALSVIADPNNQIEVSPASYWELAIKISSGKYGLQQPYQSFLEGEIKTHSFTILPIAISHTTILTTLPFHHRDPFDRLLIAQAMAEQIPLVSGDTAFDAYPVQRLW